MDAYILIIIADILLAVSFIFQKTYQNLAGISLKAVLIYNTLMGVFSAIMYICINNFEIKITGFSLLIAIVSVIIGLLYIFVGFKLMEKGNISIYTLFLLSGGMTVPYVWGVLFLGEELTLIRTLGLFTILTAIIISNSGTKKADKTQIFMCLAVFMLNGAASVIAKIHQINPVSEIVTSSDFAFIIASLKAVICSFILFASRKRLANNCRVRLSVKAILPVVLFAAIADGISYMLQLIGAAELPATVLYPMITGGSVILTAIAGVIVFKEKLSVRHWVGVAVCFVGTMLFL